MSALPDGNGLIDNQAFGLTMPEPGCAIFRDRDGKETELSACDLVDMASRIPCFIRWMLEEEHRKVLKAAKAKIDERQTL